MLPSDVTMTRAIMTISLTGTCPSAKNASTAAPAAPTIVTNRIGIEA